MQPHAVSTGETPDAIIANALADLHQSVWPRIEATELTCFKRVLNSFRAHKISEHHFYSVTGYGHDDMGRDAIDNVFANALQAEAALVRSTFASGTHAISVGLKGCLNPGDTLLVVTGPPYDTLEEVMGLRGDSHQSLKAQGVTTQIISLVDAAGNLPADWSIADETLVKQAHTIHIQRSKGYSSRATLSIAVIEALCTRLKALNPALIIFVDNCYGEFTEADEPTAVGADLMAGSLIKNPGGGIVPAGGYVAGRQPLIDRCADVLTCPGVGAHGGYTFDLQRVILQGLFLAPSCVANALKSMTFAAHCLQTLGYTVAPVWHAEHRDIIQQIHLGTKDKLIQLCKIVQHYSPINSHVTPIPAALPGYADEVIMAGGTFIEGSTIELSADGPLRAPYTAYLQGGLTFAHLRAIMPDLIEALSA
jgi:cystathionine beta-lyase family protein involved in aluminum resistance